MELSDKKDLPKSSSVEDLKNSEAFELVKTDRPCSNLASLKKTLAGQETCMNSFYTDQVMRRQKQKLKTYDHSFDYNRIENSYFSVVKDPQGQELIHDDAE